MVKMQIDVTEDVDKKVSVFKVMHGLKTKQEAINIILEKYFSKD